MKTIFYVLLVLIIVSFLAVFVYLRKNPSQDQNPLGQNLIEDFNMQVIKEGSGEQAAKSGDILAVHYVGTLENGEKFDSSRDRGRPFEFTLGAKQVIPGWDLGLMGTKVGEIRKLVIPPQLGYGDQAVGNIPANSTLNFEVELLEIKS